MARLDRVIEEKKFGVGDVASFELGKLEGEDFAGRAFFERGFERVGIARAEGAKGSKKNGPAGGGDAERETENGYAIGRADRKGIGRGAEDGDVMVAVKRDDACGYESRRLIWHTKEECGLGAVELAEDVGRGEQVAFVIDEEAVAVEKIAVAARAGSGVGLIDDGAECEG